MEKVVVQTGAKTYQIADQDGNDLGVFRFIPSDAGILKRYKEAAAFFAGINDRIKGKDFEDEDKRLGEFCKNLEMRDKILLLQCAAEVYPNIVDELYCCIVIGMSYDKMNKKKFVALDRKDFYACILSHICCL